MDASLLRKRSRPVGRPLLASLVSFGMTTFFAGCVYNERNLPPDPKTAWVPPSDPELRARPVSGFEAKDGEIPSQDATEDALPERLSVAHAIDIALGANPRTRQTWYAAKSAAAQKGSAWADYYPAIDGQYGLRKTRSEFAGQPVLIERTTSGPSLTATWTLFDFGGRAGAVDETREALTAATFAHNRELQQLVFDTQQRYFALYAAEEGVDADSRSLKDARENHEIAKKSFEVGLKPHQEVLQAESRMREAEFNLETSKASVESARASFAEILGRPIATDVKIERPDFRNVVKNGGNGVSERLERALKTRPDLMSTYASARQAKARIRTIRGAALPKIVSQANYSITSIQGGDGDERNYNVGIAVTGSIFSGFRNSYELDRAHADAEQQAERARAMELGVAAEVWSAYFNVEAAERQVGAAQSLLKASEETLRVLRGGYQEGANAFLDVLTAQTDAARARKTKVYAEANFAVAIARLSLATGELPQVTDLPAQEVPGASAAVATGTGADSPKPLVTPPAVATSEPLPTIASVR